MATRFHRRSSTSGRQLALAMASSVLLTAAGGLGAFSQGFLVGGVSTVASNGVRLDNENYTQKDLKLALEQGANAGGDISHIALAARLRVGETAIADIPLANTGHESSDFLARLTMPGAMFDLGRFWNSATRFTTASETNSPSPSPLTATSSQTSDTLPAVAGPPGTAGVSPQVSLGVPTTSSPGLPSSTPQAVSGFASTNTAPSGAQSVSGQSVAATAVNTQPTGAITPLANTIDLASTNTAPTGSASVSAQNAGASATTTKPAGLPDPSTQTADSILTNTAPSGSVAITAQTATGTATNTQPTGSAAITAQTVNGTSTTTQPTGSAAVSAQSVNGTATGAQPTGSVTVNSQVVNAVSGTSAPSGSVSITPQSVNTTAGISAPTGSVAIVAQAVDSLSNTSAPAGLSQAFVSVGVTGTTTQPTGSTGTVGDTWYPGTLSIDTNGDGATDTVRFTFVDVNTDGDLDFLDLSSDDATYGEGALSDGQTGSDNDETVAAVAAGTATHHLAVGTFTFTFSFSDNIPGGTATLNVASKTWYTGTFTIDADAGGSADDTVRFALADNDANGLFERLHLSMDDTVYAEGNLTDGVTGADDDESITTSGNVRLGAYHTFLVSFDAAPAADASDVSLTSRTWFTGSFTIDSDADGASDDTVSFVLSDANSNGVYDTIDLSTDDSTYGEGTATDGTAGNDDDERLTAAGAVRLGPHHTFTVSFDGNPANDGNDASLTSKTWFSLGLSVSSATVSAVLSDADSNGLFETLDLSSDDATYGEGATLTDGITGADDDERITAQGNVRLGAFYTFNVAYDANPAADSSDASINSRTWYTGAFAIDADADGSVDDSVSFALSDADSNGVYDTLDLSSDDGTFGEGSTLSNGITGSDDDERAASGQVRLGANYAFSVALASDPGTASADATITSKTWFTGAFVLDADADASADDSAQFALSDVNSDGLYDRIDLSTDDADFGEGTTLTDGITGTGDDERRTGSADVRLGDYHTFTLAFSASPAAGSSDASATAKTWFTGSFTIDALADGTATDAISFALSDADSNGLFDTNDLSSDDAIFGEGLAEAGITGANEDERLTSSGDVRFGAYYTFTTAFVVNPAPAGGADTSITAKTWFTASFLVDTDGDGAADDTVSLVLSDADGSNGMFDTLDVSTDDAIYGESLAQAGITGTDEDERITASGAVRLGGFLTFSLAFDVNPPADGSDVSLASKTWYAATLTIDADADGTSDDTVNTALADANSDGLYDTADLSISNTTYRQGRAEAAASADGADDASITTTSNVTLGSYTFQVAWSTAPATATNDVAATSVTWFRGNMAIDVNADGSVGSSEVAYVLTDTDSDGRYDTIDVQTDDSGSLTSGFGEGALSGQSPRQTATNDDERVGSDNAGTSADIRLGAHYLFTITFDNNPGADGSDVRAASKTWYTAQASVDVDANATAASEVAFVLGDADSDGRYDTLDIQTDDSAAVSGTFGEGTLSGQSPRQTGTNDDERLGSATGGGNSGGSADVRFGAYYLFNVAFDSVPSDAGTDITVTAKTWYTGTFSLDADADGAADDTVNIAVSDLDSDGLYTVADLSLTDSTYGQGSLVDTLLAAGNDARLTAATDLSVGSAAYLFAGSFASNPGAASPPATLTAKTHFEGSFAFDVNADGDLDGVDETLYFGISDLDSNGLYDALDISLSDLTFAEGSLTDLSIVDGNDERTSSSPIIAVGSTYAVQPSWDSNPANPGDDNDARVLLINSGTSIIVYTALNSWQVDADGDEVAEDHVYFVLSDTDSNAIVDTIDLSIGDTTFGEGSLTDSTVDFSASNNTNDERFSLSSFPAGKVVRLGTHNFLVAFDTALNADADDARVTARWYVGTWPVDVDNDDLDETIDFVQVDTDSDGLYTVIEIDGDDSGAYTAAEVHTTAGSRWRPPEGVSGVDDLGTHSTITAVDADTLLVAFHDATDGDLLFSKSTDGGASWGAPVTVDGSGTAGRYASLKALSSTTYLVSYYESTSGDLRVARSTDGGSTWSVTSVDTTGDVGQYTSLLVLDSSNAVVSYYDATNSDLKVARTADGGSSWPGGSIVTVESAGDVGRYSSIAGVRSTAVFVAYYDATNANLRVAKSLTGGATWAAPSNLDTTGDVGSFASAVAAYDSTPDDGDTVGIAYYDATNQRLKYIRTTNGGTSFGAATVVDTGDVGQYASLAAVEQGNAFVSYYDAANRKLKIARSTNGGGTWSAVTADQEQETGTYTGLVVPPASGLTKLYVSYYDADQRDLRVAESRLFADLEGHRLSVRYRLNPRITDSAVLRTRGPIQISQRREDFWYISVPGNLPPGHEQTEIRVRVHVPSTAQPGEFRGALTMEHVPE